MSEKLKESLSAMVDDEADEFEIRRVLDELAQDDELRAKWTRYHLVSSVLSGNGVGSTLGSRDWDELDTQTPEDDAKVQNPVLAADNVSVTPGGRVRAWSGRVLGVAAASAAFAIVFYFGSVDDRTEVADIEQPAQTSPVAGNAAENAPRTASIPSDLDLRRVNAYMIQHAQHTSMSNRATIPFAKLVVHRNQDQRNE